MSNTGDCNSASILEAWGRVSGYRRLAAVEIEVMRDGA